MSTKIAYIGAGSLQFGPIIVQDLLLSDVLYRNGLEIHLMDIEAEHLEAVAKHSTWVNQKLIRNAKIVTTTDRDAAINPTWLLLKIPT